MALQLQTAHGLSAFAAVFPLHFCPPKMIQAGFMYATAAAVTGTPCAKKSVWLAAPTGMLNGTQFTLITLTM